MTCAGTLYNKFSLTVSSKRTPPCSINNIFHVILNMCQWYWNWLDYVYTLWQQKQVLVGPFKEALYILQCMQIIFTQNAISRGTICIFGYLKSPLTSYKVVQPKPDQPDWFCHIYMQSS